MLVAVVSGDGTRIAFDHLFVCQRLLGRILCTELPPGSYEGDSPFNPFEL